MNDATQTAMTISRTIQLARSHGIGGAYARVMSGAIRAASSERAAKRKYRAGGGRG